MDILGQAKKALKEAEDKRQKVVDEVNEIKASIEQLQSLKQDKLQEALRLDGEVRALKELLKEGGENA